MNQIFKGAVPTEPDIRKLRETYPVSSLSPGTLILYKDVERLLALVKGTSRFQSVTMRWRKIVEQEDGIVIGVEKNKGFVVLDEVSKLNFSQSKLRSAAKAAKRSYSVTGLIDPTQLDDEQRKRLEHNVNVSSKVIAAAQIRVKAALPTMD